MSLVHDLFNPAWCAVRLDFAKLPSYIYFKSFYFTKAFCFSRHDTTKIETIIKILFLANVAFRISEGESSDDESHWVHDSLKSGFRSGRK
jgi:hypothetical protein